MADNTGDLRLQVSTEVHPEIKMDKADIQKSIDDINALLSKELSGAVDEAFKNVLKQINSTLKKGNIGKFNVGRLTTPILSELSKNPDKISGESAKIIQEKLNELNNIVETIDWAKTTKALQGFKLKIDQLSELSDIEQEKALTKLKAFRKKAKKYENINDEWESIKRRIKDSDNLEDSQIHKEYQASYDRRIQKQRNETYGAPSKNYRTGAAIERDSLVPDEVKRSIVKNENGGVENLKTIQSFMSKLDEFRTLKDQLIEKVYNGDKEALSNGFFLPKDLKKDHKELEEIYMLLDRTYNKMMELSGLSEKMSTNGTEFKSYEVIAKEIGDFFDPQKGIVNQTLSKGTYAKQVASARDAIEKLIEPQLFKDNGMEYWDGRQEAYQMFAEIGEMHEQRQKRTSGVLTRSKNPNAGRNYSPETGDGYVPSGNINADNQPLDVIPEDSEEDIQKFHDELAKVGEVLKTTKLESEEAAKAIDDMLKAAAHINKDLTGDILNNNNIGTSDERLALANTYRNSIDEYRRKYQEAQQRELDEILNGSNSGKNGSGSGNGGNGGGGNGTGNGGDSSGDGNHEVPINKEKLTNDINEAINAAFMSEHKPINVNTEKLTDDIKAIAQTPVTESEKAPISTSDPLKVVPINKEQLINDINTTIDTAFSTEHNPININSEQLTAEINKAVEAAQKISASINDKESGSQTPLPSDNQIIELFGKLQSVQEFTKKLAENPLNMDVSTLGKLKEILDTINIETLKNLTEGLKILGEVNLSGFSIENLNLSKLTFDGLKSNEIREIAEGLKLLSDVNFGNVDLTKLDFSRLQTEGIDVNKLSSIFWMFSNLGKIKVPVLDLSKLNFKGLDTEKLDIAKLQTLAGLDFSNLSIFKDLDFSKLNFPDLEFLKFFGEKSEVVSESYVDKDGKVKTKKSKKKKTEEEKDENYYKEENKTRENLFNAELKEIRSGSKLKDIDEGSTIFVDSVTEFKNSMNLLVKELVKTHHYDKAGNRHDNNWTIEYDEEGKEAYSSNIDTKKFIGDIEAQKSLWKDSVNEIKASLKELGTSPDTTAIDLLITKFKNLKELTDSIKNSSGLGAIDPNKVLPSNYQNIVNGFEKQINDIQQTSKVKPLEDELKKKLDDFNGNKSGIFGKNGSIIDLEKLQQSYFLVEDIGKVFDKINHENLTGLIEPKLIDQVKNISSLLPKLDSSTIDQFMRSSQFGTESSVKSLDGLVSEINELKIVVQSFEVPNSLKNELASSLENLQGKITGLKDSSSTLLEFNNEVEKFKSAQSNIRKGGFNGNDFAQMQDSMQKMQALASQLPEFQKVQDEIKRSQKAIGDTQKAKEYSDVLSALTQKIEEYAQKKKAISTNANNHATDNDINELEKLRNEIDQIIATLSTNDSENFRKKLGDIDNYIQNINHSAYEKLKKDIDAISRSYGDMSTQGKAAFKILQDRMADYANGQAIPDNLKNSVQGFSKNKDYYRANDSRVRSIYAQYENWKSKNTVAVNAYSNQIKDMDKRFSAALGGQSSRAEVESLNAAYKELAASASAAGKTGATVIEQISGRLRNLAVYLSSFVSVFAIFNKIRQGINTVKEFDTAMTNLRKVAEGSEQAISDFGNGSYKLADALGATNTAVIEAATEWSRLGYNIKEANELAKASVVYSNVGELSATEATTGLVASLKAFNLEASDAMSVVSKLNEIGNNYAVSSAQLGEIVEKSASSIALGGDSIDQLLAMGAAMNEVVQDAGVVGNTIKTAALRIRGAKTELEEAGLETDSMAESTSKLRKEIAALTNVAGKGGFDIMKDADTFKSTFEIFDGIAERWNDMSNINQAALLEKIAGKQRSNGVAALLGNWDKAKEALQDSINSEGSALAENEKYMESIEAHQMQMKNAWAEVWTTAINKDVINFFVDLGTGIGHVTKDLGLFQTALSAAMALYASKVTVQNGGFLATDNNGNRHIKGSGQKIKEYLGSIFKGQKTAPVMDESTFNRFLQEKELIGYDPENAESMDNYISSLQKIVEENKNATEASKQAEAALAKQLIGMKGVIPTYNQYCQKIKDENVANKAATVSTIARTAAMTAFSAAVTFGLSAAITFTITKIAEFAHASENAIEKGRQAREEIKEIHDSLCSISESVETNGEKFAKLSEGVDKNGKNISLTADEYKEFLKINNELAEAFPALTRTYDENGNALVRLGDNAKEITKNLNDLLEAQRKLSNQQIADKMDDNLKGIRETDKKYKEAMQAAKFDVEEQREMLEKLTSESFKENAAKYLNRQASNISDDDLTLMSMISAKLGSVSDKDYDTILKDIDVVTDGMIKEFNAKIAENQAIVDKNTNLNKANWNGLTESLLASIETSDAYQTLSDGFRDVIKQSVANIDWSSIDFGKNKDDMLDWINDNLYSLFDGSLQTDDGRSLTPIIEEYFEAKSKVDNGKMSVGEFQDKIEALYAALNNIDPETVKMIHFILDLDIDGKGTTVEQATNKVRGFLRKDVPDLEKKLKGLTAKELEIAQNFDIPSNVTISWEEFIKLVKQASEELNNLPKTENLADINKQKSGLDALYNKYESGTTVTTSTGSKLAKGGSSTSYKSSKEVKTVNALSIDDVATTLEANPEYERYITKIGDQYVLNMNAAEDWNKSIEKQKALIDAQLNGFGYIDQYNEMYARIMNPDSHGLLNGMGSTDIGVSSDQLDALSMKMIEFQAGLKDGSMNLQQFYTALGNRSEFNSFMNGLQDINGDFNETTDYIEEMTAMLSSSLGSSLAASSKQFVKGTKSAGAYAEELVSGSRIVGTLSKSLFGISKANGEYTSSCENAEKVTDEFKNAAKNATGSFEDFENSLNNASAIEGVIDVYEKYHDMITQYTDDNGNWMESMSQDVNYDSMVSEFSDAIADMAVASSDFKDYVCENLRQISPEVASTFSDALEEGRADTEAASEVLSQALSGNVLALQTMAQAGSQNIGTVLGDLATNVGDLLTAIGDAIKNFDFKITMKIPEIKFPSLKKLLVDSFTQDGESSIAAQELPFEFKGSAGSSVAEAIGNAVSQAGQNLKAVDFSGMFDDYDPFASDDKQKGNKEAPKRPNSRNHGSGGGSKGSGGKAETEKDFDWTTVYLDNLKKKYDELQTYVNDASNAYADMTTNVRELTKAEKQLEQVKLGEDGKMTFLGRESALQEMLGVGDEMISFYETQINDYEKGLNDLKDKITNLFGAEEAEKLWKKITEGSLDPEEWKDTYRYKSNSQIDKDKMDAISDAVKQKKEKDEAEKNLREQHQIQIENTRKLFDFRQEKLENEMKIMDREMKKLQDALNLKTTIGLVVNKSDYKTLISEAEDQISKYESKISLLNQRITEETALNPNFLGSSEYFNLEDTIGECEESIRSARIQQMEWNEEIKKIPVKRAEQFVSSMQNVLSSYNNFISELEAENKTATVDQIQTGFTLQEKLIESYKKQIQEATRLQTTYQKGSDNWYEMESTIQSAKDGISQAIVEMKIFNQQLLQIPIENLNKVATQLQNIKAALDEMVSDDETVISTAADVVNRRIEELQKGFEEKQKHYEENLINPLQEQLDLLNKQNEARQRQLALEQAHYDLQRAHDEKTVQVEKNGELVWAEDEDAVRNAQNALRDAEFADMIGRLQDQIDAYNKELDDANKKVEKQVDLWEKIAEQWNKLTTDATYEKNLDKSLETLKRFFPNIDKDSFESMSMNGDKSKMYDELKKSYSQDIQRQTDVEKAIDQNGRATTLMERVKELVTNGTITATEANGILNRIKEASKDGFSSLELLEQTLSVEQTKSVKQAISNAQKANDKAYAAFQKSLDTVKSNTSTISKYTTAWDSVKSSALEQVSQLKTMNKKLGEIKDSIEDIDFNFESDPKKKVKEPDKKLAPGGSSSSGGFVYEYGSNARSGNRPKGGDTVKYKDSNGNVIDMIIGKNAHYARGIENGAIQEPDSHRAEILKRLATSKLKKTEVPIVADIGEVVLNPNQQEQLLENFRNSVLGASSIYPVGVPTNGGNSNVNVTFGDIHVEGVQNPDEFAHALNNQFELTINQNYSKIFKH